MVKTSMHPESAALTTTELPSDFATALTAMETSGDSPTTLAEALDAFDRMMDSAGVMVSVEEMYQPEATRPAVYLGDRVEYVPCVLDALIAALLIEQTQVEIQSDPPTGDPTVHLDVTADDVQVQPATAVFSLGLPAAGIPDPTALEEMESASIASCSYINAFPGGAAYDRWAEQLSEGIVLQLDIQAFVALAHRMANGWVFAEEQ
jgi:hypothetical protein